MTNIPCRLSLAISSVQYIGSGTERPDGKSVRKLEAEDIMATVTRGGTRYSLMGTGNSMPVVLVHGLGLNRGMWQWQTDALAQRYKVITYDLVGHGQTPAGGDVPTLVALSEQLRELLDHLNIERAAVAGFSLGGMIVRRFAMDHPDRLWSLIILNSAHTRTSAATKAVQDRVDQARRDGPSATVGAALDRWFSEPYRVRHPEVMAQIRTWIMANDKQVYPGNYQLLVDGVDELIAPAPPIACPTLVMTGADDFGNSPSMSEAIAGEIAGARLVILEGLRHMAMVEAPDVFNHELVSFLDDVSRAS